jgi:hypothetical protein
MDFACFVERGLAWIVEESSHDNRLKYPKRTGTFAAPSKGSGSFTFWLPWNRPKPMLVGRKQISILSKRDIVSILRGNPLDSV